MLQDIVEQLYRVMYMVVWVHTPQDHHWMLPIFVIVLVVTPAWLDGIYCGSCGRGLAHWRRARARKLKETSTSSKEKTPPSLERFVLRATAPFQVRLVVLSVLTIPATYVLLLLPKHIINHSLAEHGPKMDFLGVALDSEALLFALCASYLLVLTANSLIKYTANVVRGRVSERIVRRIRLDVIRRGRAERSPRSAPRRGARLLAGGRSSRPRAQDLFEKRRVSWRRSVRRILAGRLSHPGPQRLRRPRRAHRRRNRGPGRWTHGFGLGAVGPPIGFEPAVSISISCGARSSASGRLTSATRRVDPVLPKPVEPPRKEVCWLPSA